MFIGGILFIFGLIIGSFLNAFLWRYSKKMTLGGRSMCPCCKHQISWYDNIPVVSWFLLSGKCRYCKKQISVQYPVVELLTGVAFALVGMFSGPGEVIQGWIHGISNFEFQISNEILIINVLILIILLFITSVLILISVYDYKTKEITNGFNLTFIISCLLYLLVSSVIPNSQHSILFNLASAMLAFAFFYSLVFFSKETWMGGGDAKFSIGIGLLLGPLGTFLAIFIASITGSVYGITMLIFGKYSKNKKYLQPTTHHQKPSHEIPFGPFLALGTFISLLFAPQIIDFYVKIVLGI